MNEINGVKVKVRPSLREAAFRKYEKWIGAACQGSIMVKPWQLPKPMKASSFTVGFREAVRAYKMFNYTSTEIPFGSEVDRICVKELEDDSVWLENAYMDRVKKGKQATEDKSLLLDDQGNIVFNRFAKGNPILEEIRIKYDEADKLTEVCNKMQVNERNKFDYGIAVIIETTCPEDEEGIKNVKEVYSNIRSEKVGERWWRLYI